MINWNKITSINEVDEIINASETEAQIIFKHSTRCGISVSALDKLDREPEGINSKAKAHLLDLLNYREVSTYIAQTLEITHQSPQVLVIKNRKVIFNSTHHAINSKDLLPALV